MLVTACGDSTRTAYSRFQDIGEAGWDPAGVLVFEPWPADSAEAATGRFKMELVMRYASRGIQSAIPVALTIEDENGVIRADTFAVGPGSPIAPALERKTFGVREWGITLDPDLRLTDGYAVTISTLAPRERTAGLLNVGLILKRNTPQ